MIDNTIKVVFPGTQPTYDLTTTPFGHKKIGRAAYTYAGGRTIIIVDLFTPTARVVMGLRYWHISNNRKPNPSELWTLMDKLLALDTTP